MLAEEKAHGATGSTFYVMARHEHRADGASYADRRQAVVEEILEAGGEVGLHGSYTAAEDLDKLAAETKEIERLAGTITGHRYHYLRIDPHRNLVPLGGLVASATTRRSDSPTPSGFGRGSRSRSIHGISRTRRLRRSSRCRSP